MSRDEILEIIKNKAAEIVAGIDPRALDSSKSLKEYGATSLELVEIVVTLMRELKIKVPRADLIKARTIDDLANAFHRASSEIAR